MYLDPGFGGMLIQVIVAIVAAGGAMAFAMRKKISSIFSKSGKKDESVAPTALNSDNLEDDVVDTLSDEDDKQE